MTYQLSIKHFEITAHSTGVWLQCNLIGDYGCEERFQESTVY